jgi:hypothetical protein
VKRALIRAAARLCALALALGPVFVHSALARAPEQATETVELPRIMRPASAKTTVPEVEFGKWQGIGYGGYLAPKDLDIDADGGFDVMIHLNGAMMADKDWRGSGLNAVIASIAIREVVGSAGYARMFSAPGYLDWVLAQTVKQVQKNVDSRATKIRRLGIASWSAGMGGVSQLLSNKENAARIDSVVLLDSFHAAYASPKTGTAFVATPGQAAMGLGVNWVDPKSLTKHLRFGKRAVDGDAIMVVSSSSIAPPDYASASETALALAHALEADPRDVNDSVGTMTLRQRADKGGLHVRTWKGGGPHDHFDQLHLVGSLVREFVTPRWNKLAEDERLHASL